MKLLLSNVMGSNPRGSADRRKKAIVDMLKNMKPNVVLLQEFGWVGIREEHWEGYDFPDEYIYVGNKEASILYQKNVNVKVLHIIELINLLKEMERRGKPLGSAFLKERMCVGVVKVPKAHFLCVSWHGQNNSLPDRKDREFKEFDKLYQ